MLEAIIITTGKKDTKEILRLNDQELYENIKLFNLKKLTGLDRINSLVPIIDLFGKMLTNKILITKYKSLYKKIKEYVYPILRKNPYFGSNIKKLKGNYKDLYRFPVLHYCKK